MLTVYCSVRVIVLFDIIFSQVYAIQGEGSYLVILASQYFFIVLLTEPWNLQVKAEIIFVLLSVLMEKRYYQ